MQEGQGRGGNSRLLTVVPPLPLGWISLDNEELLFSGSLYTLHVCMHAMSTDLAPLLGNRIKARHAKALICEISLIRLASNLSLYLYHLYLQRHVLAQQLVDFVTLVYS
jgi:hypothetical protein